MLLPAVALTFRLQRYLAYGAYGAVQPQMTRCTPCASATPTTCSHRVSCALAGPPDYSVGCCCNNCAPLAPTASSRTRPGHPTALATRPARAPHGFKQKASTHARPGHLTALAHTRPEHLMALARAWPGHLTALEYALHLPPATLVVPQGRWWTQRRAAGCKVGLCPLHRYQCDWPSWG